MTKEAVSLVEVSRDELLQETRERLFGNYDNLADWTPVEFFDGHLFKIKTLERAIEDDFYDIDDIPSDAMKKEVAEIIEFMHVSNAKLLRLKG